MGSVGVDMGLLGSNAPVKTLHVCVSGKVQSVPDDENFSPLPVHRLKVMAREMPMSGDHWGQVSAPDDHAA